MTRQRLLRTGLSIITPIIVLTAMLLGLRAQTPVVAQSALRPLDLRPELVATATSANLASVNSEPSSSPVETLAPQATWLPPSPSYRILVDTDGLYALDYTYLAAAGLPVATLDPRTFRLFHMGQEIAIRVVGENDGRFNNGDTLFFYGRSVDSLFYDGLLDSNKYTGVNAYFLTYGGSNGMRMVEKNGAASGSPAGPFPTATRIEKSLWYWSAYPFVHNADHWYSDWLQLPGSFAGRNINFTTANIASGPYTGTLTVNMLGYPTGGTHFLKLFVNGNQVLNGSPTWSGYDIYQVTVDVPQAFFLEGANTIRIEIAAQPGKPSDKVHINWLEVAYYDTYVAESNRLDFVNKKPGNWRYQVTNFTSAAIDVYDVSDHTAAKHFTATTVAPTGATFAANFGDTVGSTSRYLAVTPAAYRTPKSISPATYIASPYAISDLLASTNRVDYILITHRDFWEQALTLAEYRGLKYRVALIDAQQIYDQFNGGMMTAEAIRDFLAYAYNNWTSPRPQFVLLMGDGTYDPRNYRYATRTYIPPYLFLADPDLGETAADNRYVTIVGKDNLPDIAIGRFPVNSVEQAAIMVDKTIKYETACACDGWNDNLLFVADDLQGGGGNFREYSDRVADGYANPPTNTIKLVPPQYNEIKAYLGLTCDPNDPTTGASIAHGCRSQITNTLNFSGSLFVSYVGHSGKDTWAEEQLMNQTMIYSLRNGPCLPIVLAMTCYEGSFHDASPTQVILAEEFVRRPVNGAVASWSPTGFGLASGHDLMEQGLFLALFHNGVKQLGTAIDYGKQYLVLKAPPGKYLDLIDTFGLLGDPALEPKIAGAQQCTQGPTAVDSGEFRMVGYEPERSAGSPASPAFRTSMSSSLAPR